MKVKDKILKTTRREKTDYLHRRIFDREQAVFLLLAAQVGNRVVSSACWRKMPM